MCDKHKHSVCILTNLCMMNILMYINIFINIVGCLSKNWLCRGLSIINTHSPPPLWKMLFIKGASYFSLPQLIINGTRTRPTTTTTQVKKSSYAMKSHRELKCGTSHLALTVCDTPLNRCRFYRRYTTNDEPFYGWWGVVFIKLLCGKN